MSFIATYGTLQHYDINDNDQNYVLLNEDNVVRGSCDPVNGRYVSRVTFDFFTNPIAGVDISLYTFQRNGTSNQFSVISRYQIPSGLFSVGSTIDGVQTVTLGFNALPVVPGQYLGVGMNSKAGNCFRSPFSGQFYVATHDNQFPTFSSALFTFQTSGSAAISFEVTTY